MLIPFYIDLHSYVVAFFPFGSARHSCWAGKRSRKLWGSLIRLELACSCVNRACRSYSQGLCRDGLAVFGRAVPGTVVTLQRSTHILCLIRARNRSYAKGFAAMGLLYSGVECLVEKQRAKHDKLNATYAGCITGGMLAYSGATRGWVSYHLLFLDCWLFFDQRRFL